MAQLVLSLTLLYILSLMRTLFAWAELFQSCQADYLYISIIISICEKKILSLGELFNNLTLNCSIF